MKSLKPLLIFILLANLFQSCQKKALPKIPTDFSLLEAQSAFAKYLSTSSIIFANTDSIYAGISKHGGSKTLIWNQSRQISFGGKPGMLIPVIFDSSTCIYDTNLGRRLFNLNQVSNLFVSKDDIGNWQFEILILCPDKNSVPNNFSGMIFVEDWYGNLINQYFKKVYGNVKIRNKERTKAILNGDKNFAQNSIITVCYEISGYNYVPSTGEYHYWLYQAGCESYFIDDFPYSGNHTADEYLEIADSQGGAGGNSGSNSSDIAVIEEGPSPIANIADYTKCFSNIAGDASEYKVKLCVQQPVMGSREPWGFNSGSAIGSINPVMVGHVFLVLIQATQGSTITRNIGFYPASGVHNFTPTAIGELNNDANSGYDISLDITITSSQFFTILDYIKQANNPNYLYNLNTNNCTHFALNALGSVGMSIPRTSGTWFNGGGLNPGDLGEDIRSMPLSSNMTRSTVNNFHPNTGNCY